MSDDRAESRVVAVLEGLALQNASGELEIDGSPGGAIYLDRGEVTFARSAWSPDLGTRLHGALGPVTELRDLLAAEDRPAGNLGGQLVRRGYLSAAGLESIVRSVVLDAIIVLTVPLSADAAISGIRLVSGVSHWAEAFCRLNVAAIRAEAVRRGGQMFDLELGQGARLPCASKPGPQPQVVSGLAPGRVTARGVTTRVRLPKAAASGSGGQASGASPVRPGRRPARADAITGGGVDKRPGTDADADFSPVSVESMRRVLEGLRQLS